MISKINYKNADVNNTYLVKLVLSGARKKAVEPKHHIEYFETK
ncbi:hypothetical protein [Mesoplasma melaleucae]|nr:hypothetical protein [Mesoplasma melaleucae]